jgi:ATPase subunit of ABC transporter with duplicated ATPase domains
VNVILLDGPTNALDVNTLRALEEALEEFEGKALVVSHDRWFFDRICTHLIVFEDDAQATMHIGNWSDYEAMMIEKYGKDLTPHRVKYRTLKR